MAITSITSSSQSILQQLQLQQAQRNVDQAEQRARTLQIQAGSAQAAADQAQAEASMLKSDAVQAQSTADQASQWLQAARSLGQIGTQVSSILTKVVQAQAAAQPAANVQTPQPVVNTQGQKIGTVVNTTA